MNKIFHVFNLILFSLSSFSQTPVAPKMSSQELLINSTIRLYCEQPFTDSLGKRKIRTSTGTGFFYNFKIDSLFYTVIFTNKHVVANSSNVTLEFKKSLPSGTPSYGQNENVIIQNFQNRIIYHPDSSIDLAIFPIGDILNEYAKRKMPLISVPFDESLIPTDSIFRSIGSLEDVFMIGYPHGIFDPYNNLPIARKGITSTPPYLRYDNKDEFLVDIANFNGSSGSPIILYNPISLNNGGISFGTRLYLIGINYEAFFYNYEGMVIKEDPTVYSGEKIRTLFPINIAIVLRADKIKDFKPLLTQRFGLK